MSTLLTFGLANAVCAALLAVVALIIGRFCHRPAVLHSLWLLVLLKLMTPPVWPITIANLPEEAPPPADTTVTTPAEVAMYVSVDPSSLPPGVLENAQVVKQARYGGKQKVAAERTATDEHLSTQRKSEKEQLDLSSIRVHLHSSAANVENEAEQSRGPASCVPLLCVAWAAGIVVWLICVGLHVARFQCLLRYARRASPEIQEQCDGLAARMGLLRGPEIWLLPGPLPPLVWAAMGRVRIFFPVKLLDRLDESECGSLLAHELAHVRRRDHWVRWLELIVSAVYWWYPLVWLARRRLHVHEEECCDAWVVGEVSPRVYAGAILNTLDFLAEDQAPLPVMASGLAGVELIKRRLNLIMEGSAPKSLSSTGKIALMFAGMLLLSLRPNLAHTETKPPEAKESEEKPAAKVDEHRDTTAEDASAFNPKPNPLAGPKLESTPLAIARSPD